MKRIIIAAQLLIIMFLFCSCNTSYEIKETENVSSTVVSSTSCNISYETKEPENVSSTVQNAASSTSRKYITESETSLQINENNNDFFLNNIMAALIDKDESELWRIGYIEGKEGFLYNVDFKSYKILNVLSFQRADTAEELVYTVELNISRSSDIRFPVGTSIWNIGVLESEFCIFFLPETIDEHKIDEYWNNKHAQIGRYYTFSFNENNDIQDTKKLSETAETDILEEGVRSFLIGMKPELRNGGDVFVEKNVVDEVLNQYLGISDCSLCDDKSTMKCDSNRWQSETVYALISEQCDEYIDITYYADFAYITPAYKIRYYFNNESNPLNLTEVKTIEDYGYKPFTLVF